MDTKQTQGKARFWTLVWGLGLAGQLCWNIENQWFNTFVYAKIAKDSGIVTAMVVASALVTAFATFFFGTLSDRRGQRRRFIAVGYILWGVLTIAFGFSEFIASGALRRGAGMVALAAVFVVLMDCAMSFFGSMSNDAGYNAWTNDMTTPGNRGQIGAALATQPVIGTIVGTLAGGALIGSEDNYQRLFWVMGLLVIAMGVLALLFLRDAPGLRPHRAGSFWRQLASVFDFKSLALRRELMAVCLTASAFFMAFNVFFAHIGNWLIYHLGFTAGQMGLLQGGGLIAAMLLAIPAVWLINRGKTPLVAAVSVVFTACALLVANGLGPDRVNTASVLSRGNALLFVAVFLIGAGYVLFTQAITIWVKELYPQESRGQFEGVRILSFVLLPMLTGTVLGNAVVKAGAGSVVNALGVVENIPTGEMFIWGAALLVLVPPPLLLAARHYRRRKG